MADAIAKKALDFTNVKESSGINTVQVEPGDYRAKIVSVSDEPSKEGKDMWMFAFQLETMRSAVYPYYCVLQENQLWKIRNLLIATGKDVPKKRVNVDPNKLVGQVVAITLVDGEHDGKPKSEINAVFSVSELDDEAVAPETDDADESGDLDLDDF